MAKRQPLAEWIDFAQQLTRRPRETGAIAPSGKQLARLMAEAANLADTSRVLELGPGTGAITKALIGHGVRPEALVLLEYDTKAAAKLRKLFPDAETIVGDAFDPAVQRALGPFDAVVSGIPLLNFPKPERCALIETLLTAAAPGAPFVQFSYGTRPPVPPSDRLSVSPGGKAPRNLPPAKVWVYRLAEPIDQNSVVSA